LQVDYTPYLSEQPTFAADAGDAIEITGVQPSIHGALVVDSASNGLVVVGDEAAAEAAYSRQ
jgi:hypothetical protein